MLRVPKSFVDAYQGDFAADVAAHKAEAARWTEHMERVEGEKSLPPLEHPSAEGHETAESYQAALSEWTTEASKRHAPYPAPVAHPIIAQAAEHGYLVVDDGPTPQEIFEAKRADARAAITAAEVAEAEKVFPTAKRRYADILVSEVLRRDADRFTETKVGVEGRSAEDKKIMAERSDREAKLARIERWAAKQQFELEDVGPDAIDGWTIEPYSET